MKTFQFQKSHIDYFYDYHTIVDMPYYRIESVGGGWLIESTTDSSIDSTTDNAIVFTSCEIENMYKLSFNLLKDEYVFIYIDDNGLMQMQTYANHNRINI